MSGPLHTRVCELLRIEHPVVLAGMSPVAGPELVAAVSNAGGLGVLGATHLTPTEIRTQIHRVRELTSMPFGVDLLLPADGGTRAPSLDLARRARDAARDACAALGLPEPSWRRTPLPNWSAEARDAQVRAVVAEAVPVFAAGLGTPAPYVEALHAAGTKVIALVGNERAAVAAASAGIDVVVAQGAEAGGHTGTIGTFALVPQVVDAVAPLPVLAAGGIVDGRGLAAALALGADGAWCGTAFLGTFEVALDGALRERVLAATAEDARATTFFSGRRMRVLASPLTEWWEARAEPPLPPGAQVNLAAAIEAAAEAAAHPELLRNPAGQAVGLVTEVRPAAAVLTSMVEEAVAVATRFSARLVGPGADLDAS